LRLEYKLKGESLSDCCCALDPSPIHLSILQVTIISEGLASEDVGVDAIVESETVDKSFERFLVSEQLWEVRLES
jgi:hypothetical protein